MSLAEVLHLLRWVHCTICTSDPFSKKLDIYRPTMNYDELGVTYLKYLPDKVLTREVVVVRPTMYNYANIYIKVDE